MTRKEGVPGRENMHENPKVEGRPVWLKTLNWGEQPEMRLEGRQEPNHVELCDCSNDFKVYI